ncbi:MAG: hypothetical protein FJW83_06540 [Actinobacteria bacterium]|nr:hypothetical protein [Actinomycetota bacterium]
MATHGRVTERDPWTSVAEAAVCAVLGAGGHAPCGVTVRDVHVAPHLRWASFDHTPSGDVLWAAQLDGSAPAGSQAVSTDLGDVGVWWHPNDPALPSLRDAVTEGGLTAVAAALASEIDPQVVHVVSLQPLEHAVVRVGRPGHAV